MIKNITNSHEKYDILYVLILLILAGMLGWNISYDSIEGDISSSFQAWNRQITVFKMTQEFPLWDQQAWGGMTFIGQIMQPAYPLLWIAKFIFFNTTENTLSTQILFAISSMHMIIFSLGLYGFLRVNNYSKISSFIVALMVSCTAAAYSKWPFIWGATGFGDGLRLFVDPNATYEYSSNTENSSCFVKMSDHLTIDEIECQKSKGLK